MGIPKDPTIPTDRESLLYLCVEFTKAWLDVTPTREASNRENAACTAIVDFIKANYPELV